MGEGFRRSAARAFIGALMRRESAVKSVNFPEVAVSQAFFKFQEWFEVTYM